MNILTLKQEIILRAMKNFFASNGRMPTVRELKGEVSKLGLNLKSLRSVFIYINVLRDKGYIRKNLDSGRIEFVDKSKANFVNVPVLGVASAGTPTFFAEENIEGYIKISKKIIRNKKVFAIKVSGDSMDISLVNSKKIEDGDYIIIDSNCKDYYRGEKVLVIIDGLATVKTYERIDKYTIGLFPESTDKKYTPIYLTNEDDFIINGKVIDVLKTFSHGK
jgi:repressor LexA